LDGFSERLESFRSGLVSTDAAGWLSGEELLREELGNLYGGINGYDGRPSQSQLDRQVFLHAKLEKARASFEELTGTDALGELNSQLDRKGLEPLAVMSRASWESDGAAGGASVAVELAPKSVGWLSRILPRLPLRLR